MGAEADAVRRWFAGAILVMLASALPGCGGQSGSGGAGSISGAAVPVARGNDPVARAALPAIQPVQPLPPMNFKPTCKPSSRAWGSILRR